MTQYLCTVGRDDTQVWLRKATKFVVFLIILQSSSLHHCMCSFVTSVHMPDSCSDLRAGDFTLLIASFLLF